MNCTIYNLPVEILVIIFRRVPFMPVFTLDSRILDAIRIARRSIVRCPELVKAAVKSRSGKFHTGISYMELICKARRTGNYILGSDIGIKSPIMVIYHNITSGGTHYAHIHTPEYFMTIRHTTDDVIHVTRHASSVPLTPAAAAAWPTRQDIPQWARETECDEYRRICINITCVYKISGGYVTLTNILMNGAICNGILRVDPENGLYLLRKDILFSRAPFLLTPCDIDIPVRLRPLYGDTNIVKPKLIEPDWVLRVASWLWTRKERWVAANRIFTVQAAHTEQVARRPVRRRQECNVS